MTTAIQLIFNSNTLLNIAILVGVMVAAFRVGAGKLKDATIADLNARVDSLKGRVEQLDSELGEARSEALRCHTAAKEWEARYNEQSKYTAQGALADLKDVLTAAIQQGNADRRALTQMLQSHGELVLRNTAIVAAVAQKLSVDTEAIDGIVRGTRAH